MRILVIDNNIETEHWGSEELKHYSSQTVGSTVWVRRAPEGDLPKDPGYFDRIVISGSKTSAMESAPWISDLHEFLKRALNGQKAVLGVCYGHQVLVRILGGDQLMRASKTPEIGWQEIIKTHDSKLLKGLPERFFSYCSHYQEVTGLPAGLRQTAKSDLCEVQGFESKEGPVFGIEFHPEKQLEDAVKSLKDHQKNKKSVPALRPNESHKLYDPSVADQIFANFFDPNL